MPRQQFVEPTYGMALADPVEHIGQPGLRVHTVELGRLQQGVDRSSAFTAAIGPGKEPVLPAYRDTAQ